jgi:REP-associated tyrosine transposase
MAARHTEATPGLSTYFITAATFQKHSLFQSDRMANLFLEVLLHYRTQQKYLLHEFVIMPDHFHLLLTPTLTLERALQLIKVDSHSAPKRSWDSAARSARKVSMIGA